MTTKGFLIGMLAGTVVGAVLGLLYAPQSGVDARRCMTDTAKSARDKASGMAAELKEKIAHGAENVRQAI